MRKSIDAETKARIVAMRKEGLTYSAICRLLRLTKGQVAGELWRAGLCQPKMCEECGKNPADPPSRLCPGCQAYKEHVA